MSLSNAEIQRIESILSGLGLKASGYDMDNRAAYALPGGHMFSVLVTECGIAVVSPGDYGWEEPGPSSSTWEKFLQERIGACTMRQILGR